MDQSEDALETATAATATVSRDAPAQAEEEEDEITASSQPSGEGIDSVTESSNAAVPSTSVAITEGQQNLF